MCGEIGGGLDGRNIIEVGCGANGLRCPFANGIALQFDKNLNRYPYL